MEEKKLGRPSKYSTTIVKNILNRLAKGEAIRNVVKEEGIDWETWRQWLIKKPGLARRKDHRAHHRPWPRSMSIR